MMFVGQRFPNWGCASSPRRKGGWGMEKLWMDKLKANMQAARAGSDTAEVKVTGLSRYSSRYYSVCWFDDATGVCSI